MKTEPELKPVPKGYRRIWLVLSHRGDIQSADDAFGDADFWANGSDTIVPIDVPADVFPRKKRKR